MRWVAKEMRGRFEHVLSNLQRLLNWKDLERANGGGARARALSRAVSGGGDARGAVSSGGGVERAFAGVRRGAARAAKKFAKKAGACLPRAGRRRRRRGWPSAPREACRAPPTTTPPPVRKWSRAAGPIRGRACPPTSWRTSVVA